MEYCSAGGDICGKFESIVVMRRAMFVEGRWRVLLTSWGEWVIVVELSNPR